MKRLLLEHADKIIEFEEIIREKYKVEDIELKVKSYTSYFGEELRVECEQGDYLFMFYDEDGELEVKYHYAPMKNDKEFSITVDETATYRESWDLEIIKLENGDFTYKNWRDYVSTHSFTDIDSLVEHVIEHDTLSKQVTYSNNEVEFDYTILED
ncbi:hypothetical protein [Staphylococcus delphini]|uniref:Phage protein n=1 Tax=Staphylococcus delphini TaxID=53344 RepID=A0AAX0QUT6_9STAP|nr:hypothetical protein [Staphylococcus delphini]PCF50088.1 hypothetical protein B5C07_07730 [Staphylococcus delphini]PNZ95709.1 hypothetical protein CD148_03270 [Staphylococcus delphini]RIZ56280.1 hypothetical protein CDL68_01695 [Staphylococcus delphini]VED62514.1 Uncharacterised protein [Staphylococcus delphini]